MLLPEKQMGETYDMLNRLPFNEYPIKIPSSRQYSILREIREPVIFGSFVNFDSS